MKAEFSNICSGNRASSVTKIKDGSKLDSVVSRYLLKI